MPRAKFEIRKRLDPEIQIVSDAVPSNPSLRVLFTEYNKFVLGWLAALLGI
jgi:hypothetical protein